MNIEQQEVIFDGAFPRCPICKKATRRKKIKMFRDLKMPISQNQPYKCLDGLHTFYTKEVGNKVVYANK